MRNLELRIAYNGAGFHGWQIQPRARTVQGEVAAVLKRILKLAKIKTVGCSRTDAGVHAHDQRVSFQIEHPIPLEGLQRALERLLPPDIQLLEVCERPPGFQARHHARAKHYGYFFLNPPGTTAFNAWQNLASPFIAPYVTACAEPLDVEAMARAAEQLVGTRCFKALQSCKDHRPNSETTIFATRVRRHGSLVTFDVLGHHFLYLMVRNMAGSLKRVGTGEWAAEDFGERLNRGNRVDMGETAPATGLHLFEVYYEEDPLGFSPKSEAFQTFLGAPIGAESKARAGEKRVTASPAPPLPGRSEQDG
ncbi:tRNA pseudouridine(38-40) synthase TruA [Sulfidibacter corallicola]|uniref:tRNA pseudouridine synthase A n=1 Tax=Sulfidibacter corallicola TaxID=2818388 RepID=A0A8A4TED9_SULCO|nr:tRNA pseudouridine(38-40) synthase TruA [Sulfidibacter corallicola]QTD47594.1 tRNA pseudouridine(38-40) synthase TruA [Sulfidibacter corallicola]